MLFQYFLIYSQLMTYLVLFGLCFFLTDGLEMSRKAESLIESVDIFKTNKGESLL